MKREGRQHGMVRTYRIPPSPWNPTPKPQFVQQFDSLPIAGVFTKVPAKPTNHSKFTGRCGRPRCLECHMHPTWFSAAMMLDHLSSDYGDCYEDEDRCDVVSDGFEMNSQSQDRRRRFSSVVIPWFCLYSKAFTIHPLPFVLQSSSCCSDNGVGLPVRLSLQSMPVGTSEKFLIHNGVDSDNVRSSRILYLM
ncbi:hypothetical protein V6N13_133410 [Hibiscus sabdariffa]|uniref:Uncharacterized protein n=1 Tax=Hibiscus sabdariffa TaxID=183260 RepID=A0ABR2CIN5_9ROSI